MLRWYFDAVSSGSGNESISIVFHNYGSHALDFPPDTVPTVVQIGGTFANGTSFSKFLYAEGGAKVSVSSAGVSGKWDGTGGSFYGTSLDLSSPLYTVVFDDPEQGVSGILTMRAVRTSTTLTPLSQESMCSFLSYRFHLLTTLATHTFLESLRKSSLAFSGLTQSLTLTLQLISLSMARVLSSKAWDIMTRTGVSCH